jgi:hypothetical protein
MSFMLDNADLLEGDATSASEVDFVISGIANVTRGQLADGQLANSKGPLYTAASSVVVSSVIYTNTGAAHNHVNLYSKSSGGTSRRLIPKDLQLEAGYALYFDGVDAKVRDINGGIVSGLNVSDTAYAASWDGVTGVAPSKNAVYDQMELKAPKASPTFTGPVLGDGFATDQFTKTFTTATAEIFHTHLTTAGSGGIIVDITYGGTVPGVGNLGGSERYMIDIVNGTMTATKSNGYGSAKITVSVTDQTATFSVTGSNGQISVYNFAVSVLGVGYTTGWTYLHYSRL